MLRRSDLPSSSVLNSCSFSFDEGDNLLPSLTATAITNTNGNGTLTSSPPKSSPSDQPQSTVSIGQDWDTFSTLGLFEDASTVTPLAAMLLSTETNNKEKDEGKGNTVDVTSTANEVERQLSGHKA